MPSTSGPSITEENPSAVQLESQTQALQDFFFGTLAETKADALSNVKSTTAPLAEHGIKVQDASSASQSTSQARYLQNLQVLSPIPKSPGRTVENLHRQIMRRGYEQAGQVLPSDYQANPSSGPSTIKAPSAFHDAFSSIGSPSFTDYRNSALSPSGFDSHSSINPVMRPVYTEAEREAARYSLLGQLASELGTPTPPSADESTDDDVTDEGTSRQESPGKDLMDLIHQQLRQVQPYGASATRAQEDGQPAGLMKVADSVKETANPYATSNTASSAAVHAALQSSPPSAPLDSAQAPTQHMLSILNGTSDAGTKMTFRQNGSTGHLQGPVTAQVSRIVTDEALPAAKNSAAHASSLLSLFNVQPRTATIPSATPTAQSSGHGDLARLFADVRL